AGYQAVLHAGACYIETDVQVTADHVPILSHDPDLARLTGHDYRVTEAEYPLIRELPAGYPERFGESFDKLRIARLDEFAVLLKQWPQARAFIEIKQDSTRTHGTARVVGIILNTLVDVLPQCILISFEHEVLVTSRKLGNLPIGWVIPEWSEDSRGLARHLNPEYLFCSRKRLPPETGVLWQGDWRWVVYTVNEVDEVLAFGKRGIDMVETNRISQLLVDPKLNPGS
ncbi:MAG: glycerophosphodiester phosphodiesterase family protein, partial [Pseudomonadota bacterium]|nr:glycerophosphodiester phosphodiesterase family protein [Pseudomonadota bacterium]